MNTVSQHQVTRLHYSRSKRRLEIAFADEAEYQLTAEFLRVFSPSAEVRGHGPGQETLQTGKSSVGIAGILFLYRRCCPGLHWSICLERRAF